MLTPLGKEVEKRLDEIYGLMEEHLSGVSDDYSTYINPHLDKIIEPLKTTRKETVERMNDLYNTK